MELTGPALALRPPAAGDAEALFALGRDPEVTRWFSWGPYRSVDEPRAWIAAQAGRRERGEALALAMLHHEHGLVGITELSDWSARDRRAVVGTWFARRWWGTGLNAESKQLVATLAFEHCGLERLGAYADVANARSHAALAKAGFTREGVLRAFHRHGARQKDVAVLSLLRAEWEPRIAAGADGRGARRVPPGLTPRPALSPAWPPRRTRAPRGPRRRCPRARSRPASRRCRPGRRR
jgi:ribosomal-protein-alanine N-acetyltransferase